MTKESNASESDEETTPSVKATRAVKPGIKKSSTSAEPTSRVTKTARLHGVKATRARKPGVERS